ncbi:MAG: hypothetical protein NVS3B15_02260 [Sediminibacterium sp.]
MPTVNALNDHKAGIAPFKIILVNGHLFTYSQLKKDQPVVLVYFSPTCDHCKEFTKELIRHQVVIKNKQVVMITYEPLNAVKEFDSFFGLSAFPNIKVGTEGYTFIVQRYYQVKRFPFIAMYHKSDKLAGVWTDQPVPEKLFLQIMQL